MTVSQKIRVAPVSVRLQFLHGIARAVPVFVSAGSSLEMILSVSIPSVPQNTTLQHLIFWIVAPQKKRLHLRNCRGIIFLGAAILTGDLSDCCTVISGDLGLWPDEVSMH